MQPAVGDPALAGVGLDDLQRALPTSAVLGFCMSEASALVMLS